MLPDGRAGVLFNTAMAMPDTVDLFYLFEFMWIICFWIEMFEKGRQEVLSKMTSNYGGHSGECVSVAGKMRMVSEMARLPEMANRTGLDGYHPLLLKIEE